METYKNKCHLL